MGLPCDQCGESPESSASNVASEGAGRRTPIASAWSRASTPAPPPLVMMASRSPPARRPAASISAAAES